MTQGSLKHGLEHLPPISASVSSRNEFVSVTTTETVALLRSHSSRLVLTQRRVAVISLQITEGSIPPFYAIPMHEEAKTHPQIGAHCRWLTGMIGLEASRASRR